MTEEKKSESYKGYVDKASYVEAQVMGLRERIEADSGRKAVSTARKLFAYMVGFGIMALGGAIVISVGVIANDQAATWSAWQIFSYTLLGFLGLAILAPLGWMVLIFFTELKY